MALLLMTTAGVITATADAALMIRSFQAPARGPLLAPSAHGALYRAVINVGS
ncbi:hypothetical protein [Nonomuraea sp. JJY05]|uniref:hypothetical protein n=1 Tax=Nonomuraea sp. JJY05 TaxID=3350255 RepID=UPI00373EA3AE